MEFRPVKNSARQEMIGKAAVMVLAIVLAIAGTAVMRAGVILLRAAREVDSGNGMAYMVIMVAVFMYLAAAAILALTFIPERKNHRGSPHALRAVWAVFDLFWRLAGSIFRINQ